MNILILNTYPDGGGAAVAARRLAGALRSLGSLPPAPSHRGGVEQVLPCGEDLGEAKVSPMGGDLEGASFFLRKAWERFVIWTGNGFSKHNLWTVSIANTGVDITKTKEFRDADVIHLHWVNQGFLSLRSIEKILAWGKPVVWTMHDMWPLTGICHHAGRCENYTTGCGNCPLLRFHSKNDLSARVFREKLRIWNVPNLHFTAVSTWLKEKAEASPLMHGKEIAVIPNMVSLEEFPLLDKTECRLGLDLPQDAHIVAFGAAKLDDPIKGFQHLCKALGSFKGSRVQGFKSSRVQEFKSSSSSNVHLVIFGSIKGDREAFLKQIPVPCTYLGPIPQTRIAEVLNAADVVVSSSLYETFGQTLIEGMACGCVPVSFGNSGQRDIIRHKKNGYLAEYLNTYDLAEGIHWALEAQQGKSVQGVQEVQEVKEKFSVEVVTKQYIELYETALGMD